MNTVCGIYGLRYKTTNKWYVGQSIDIYDTYSGCEVENHSAESLQRKDTLENGKVHYSHEI